MIYAINQLTHEIEKFFNEEEATKYITNRPNATGHEWSIYFPVIDIIKKDNEITHLKDQLHRRNLLVKKLREELKKAYVTIADLTHRKYSNR